jgi:hypothetical protein
MDRGNTIQADIKKLLSDNRRGQGWEEGFIIYSPTVNIIVSMYVPEGL